MALIDVADKRAKVAWREKFPRDVINENEFFKQQQQAEPKAPRQTKRARKAFILTQMEGPATIDDDDPRWADLFLSTASISSDSDIEFDDYIFLVYIIGSSCLSLSSSHLYLFDLSFNEICTEIYRPLIVCT
jgi:hypothetical protein